MGLSNSFLDGYVNSNKKKMAKLLIMCFVVYRELLVMLEFLAGLVPLGLL